MMQERIEVTCPCCRGERRLVFVEAIPCVDGTVQYVEVPATCCHCQGAGTVFLDQRSDNRHE